MSTTEFKAVPGVDYDSEAFTADCHAQEVRELAKRGQATMAELLAAEQAAKVAAKHAQMAIVQRYGDEDTLDAGDDSDEDEVTERRREYHDDIHADFKRLGLV